jgi:long-chain fatty acid transport protein
MNKFMTAGAALLATTTIVSAGGIDRSGQPITAIFEDGNYVELSFGSISPSVTGTAFGTGSGNMAPTYSTFGMALKTDINDQASVAIILDQPFGANVDYDSPGYLLDGTTAEVNSTAITVVGRYKINDSFSVHGGIRHLTAEGSVNLSTAPYASDYSPGNGMGYVIGAAYERPDIAMRIALTYSSAIDIELEGTAGDLVTTMPQSVNLDFQTGIAADTLLFGSIRWADWTETVLLDTAAGALATYDEDVYTYSIGVGRRFSDALSGAVTVGYEAAQGGESSNLSPSDGNVSLSLGGTYTMSNGLELSGGVRYVWLGDAETSLAPAPFPGVFEDNTAVAVGLKVAYNF